MVKFCTGDFRPESIPLDTKHLDPLLAKASKSPPAQVPDRGLDGMFSYKKACVSHRSAYRARLNASNSTPLPCLWWICYRHAS